MKIIAISGVLIFGFLSLIHIYWAFGGAAGVYKAIPVINSKPVFSPNRFITIVVALALAICGLVALALGFSTWINIPLFQYVIYLGWVIAGVFFLRAIGDFKLVGFFKKVKDSEFAKYDSWFYSPLCLALSLMFSILAFSQG